MPHLPLPDTLSRIEVIDETGRAFVAYYDPKLVTIYEQLQDDDRTLKIFVKRKKPVIM